MILLSGSNGLLGSRFKKYLDQNKIKYSTIGKEKCDFNGDIKVNSFVEKTIKRLAPNVFINMRNRCRLLETNKEEAYKEHSISICVSRTLKFNKRILYSSFN